VQVCSDRMRRRGEAQHNASGEGGKRVAGACALWALLYNPRLHARMAGADAKIHEWCLPSRENVVGARMVSPMEGDRGEQGEDGGGARMIREWCLPSTENAAGARMSRRGHGVASVDALLMVL
jgi:hypothetical protein